MKKLGMIFGPVLVAFVLTFCLFYFPTNSGPISQKIINRAAVSLSANVLKGERIKTAAFKEKRIIPYIGSSELSRMDAFHPSVLAHKYHRSYQPFLMGSAGSQSLTHYFSMAYAARNLASKKAVVIISPQWFVKGGVSKPMFDYYYSSLQTAHFLLKARNTVADRYAAKRLVELLPGSVDPIVENATVRRAAGLSLTTLQFHYLKDIESRFLEQEDNLFSRLFIINHESRITRAEADLPQHYQLSKLEQLATSYGQKQTSTNQFGIKNNFFKERIRPNLKALKGIQRDYTYTKSPEFSDFELLLSVFAAYHIQPIFIIPPVNAKWANYTGLSAQMLTEFSHKITYQLKSQGFKHIVDLTADSQRSYFMEDTIHLGWHGWLAVDQATRPFLEQQQIKPEKIKLNHYFYTKKWQQLDPNQVPTY